MNALQKLVARLFKALHLDLFNLVFVIMLLPEKVQVEEFKQNKEETPQIVLLPQLLF